MKIVAICRVSTTKQEIQSQIDELKSFILKDGVVEDDIIWVTGVGVSAVKEDDKFKANIEKVLSYIKNGNIDCVYAWELSRIARKQKTMALLIDELIQHKVNLKIQNPRLELFTNGMLNDGMLLAINLFTTLAESEMRNKQDRFTRAKKRDKQLGLYLGGKIPCGYDVIERRYVLNEEADIIKMVFNMYSTGQYSFATLAEELQKQGIEKDEYWVCQRLKYQAYWDGSLPQIIPIEIAEKCCKIREQNKTNMPRTIKHHYFANRILKCPKCGYGYTSSARTYICCECKHGERISIKWLDGLLWLIASHHEGEARLNDTDHEKAVKEKEAVLERKIKAVDNYKAKAEKRLIRAKEAYLNGVIDLTEYKAKTQADESMIKDLENEKVSYTNELELLRQPVKSSFDRVLKIADEIEESDEQEMRSIVRKWVKSVTIDDGIVYVETLVRNYRCKYLPKSWNGRFFTTGGRRIVVRSIERSVDGAKLGKAVGDVNDVVITTAWLSGSVIV